MNDELPWPLVVAHHVDEPLFERLGPALDPIEPHTAVDQPARQGRERFFPVDLQPHEAILAGHVSAERVKSLDKGRFHGIDLQLDLEPRTSVDERHLVNDTTVLDEGDAVAGDLDLAEQVRVEEDRRPARPEIADEIADQQAAERVEPRGWLVEKDQFWIVDERLRQAGALQHALAVLPQRTLGRIEQIHAREQVLDADVERDAAEPVQSSVEPQQLAARPAVVKPEMFREEADARPRG